MGEIMSIWRWAERFSNVPAEHRLTLGEGGTPLVRSRRIGPSVGLDHLYFKLESCNPTGSYKDRFAAAALSDMRWRGKTKVVATSSGNTGAALAAYSAAAGVPCVIAILETAPRDKLKQMLAYGARLVMIKGFGIDAAITAQVLTRIKDEGERPGANAAVQISAFRYSPAGMAGVQTIGYELAEQSRDLGAPLGHVFVPAGGGGLTLAVARGLAQSTKASAFDDVRYPISDRNHGSRVEVVQPEGNDTMAGPLRRGESRGCAVQCTSKVSGLQVPSLIDADEVIAACRANGGTGHTVSDAAVFEMQGRLAREEGVFSEPAGATAAAAVIEAVKRGEVRRDMAVVALVTGSGFKDAGSVDRMLSGVEVPMISAEELMARGL